MQWPTLRREGFRYRPILDLRDPGLRQVLLLMGPGTVGLAATQVNLFVSTLLATGQGTGAVSWLQYAFRVMYLPIGLFGVSIATAVLPAAARHAALDDRDAIRRTVVARAGADAGGEHPGDCGLVALSHRHHPPAARTRALHGSRHDRHRHGAALYAVGLVGYSTTRIASPVFYALGRSRVPVALSVVSMLTNLGLSLALVRVMGFGGLALATSLAALVNAALCILLLRRHLDGLAGRSLALTCLKTTVASAAMTMAVVGVNRSLSGATDSADTTLQALHLVAAIGAGLLVLAVTSRMLHIREFTSLSAEARKRVQKLLDR